MNLISEMTLEDLAEYITQEYPHLEWGAGTLTVHRKTNQRIRTQTPGDLPYGWYPVLLDPATLGCLLHIVRQIHGYDVYLTLGTKGWIVWKARDKEDALPLSFPSLPTEAHALTNAIRKKIHE